VWSLSPKRSWLRHLWMRPPSAKFSCCATTSVQSILGLDQTSACYAKKLESLFRAIGWSTSNPLPVLLSVVNLPTSSRRRHKQVAIVPSAYQCWWLVMMRLALISLSWILQVPTTAGRLLLSARTRRTPRLSLKGDTALRCKSRMPSITLCSP